MAIIAFSYFDIRLARAREQFQQIVEADIRGAHGDPVTRPALSEIPQCMEIPQYMYDALAHSLDEDQKAYDAEVEAQWRLKNES